MLVGQILGLLSRDLLATHSHFAESSSEPPRHAAYKTPIFSNPIAQNYYYDARSCFSFSVLVFLVLNSPCGDFLESGRLEDYVPA